MTEMKQQMNPYPLGAHREEGGIRFSFVSRTEDCGVLLYDRKSGKRLKKLPFVPKERIGNVYCKYVEDIDAASVSYQFYEGERVVADRHARGFTGLPAYGKICREQDRKAVFIADDYDWQEDIHPLVPYEQCICYCLHVRGFTMHTSSGVSHKGTFKGLLEKLPYLEEIGITTVELQPIYEFQETPEPEKESDCFARPLEPLKEEIVRSVPGYRRLNYWGYQQGFYYAPKAAYAATADPSAELKEVVREFHKNGMEIILQFYFPRLVYGAEIAEILRFWVMTYHVDGFHLLGEDIPITQLAEDPMLAYTKLWYDSFATDSIYEQDETPAYRNLAEYRDDYLYTMRRFLKGDENMLSSVLYQMRHIPQKTGRIHYLSNYYGFTMMDMVSFDHKHNEANGEGNRDGNDYNCSWNCGEEGSSRRKKVLSLRMQQLRNAFCMLLLTQSTPLIFMGDEFGNSQQGNNNPYCQDNKITWLDWRDRERHKDILNYWKRLLAFRNEHPILHPKEELRILDTLSCGYPDLSYHGQNAWRVQLEERYHHVGMLYCGQYAVLSSGEADDFLYIAMNMHWEPHELALPRLPKELSWKMCFTTTAPEQKLSGKTQTAPEQACSEEARAEHPSQTACLVRIEPRSIAVYKSIAVPQKTGKRRKNKQAEMNE